MTLRNKYVTFLKIFFIFFTSQPTFAHKMKERIDPDWVKEPNKPIVYLTSAMEEVSERKDITYKKIENTELQLNLYSPKKSNKKLPVVIIIHGGPVPDNLLTQPKDWGMFSSYGRLLAASGFVAITFNYRLFDTNSYFIANGDIKDLIDYVRKNSDSLGIDKDKVFTWFFSGGGAFIAPIIKEPHDYIRGIIGFYPVLDINYFKEDLPASLTKESINLFSASLQIDNTKGFNIPILLARAGLDSPEINIFIDRFVQAAISKNVDLKLFNHSKGLHGFDNDKNDGAEKTKEIIKHCIEFIKANSR